MTRERLRYAACFAAALGCHAAVLFAIHAETGAKALAIGETESAVELALVEAAPALEPAAAPAEAPPPEPLPPPDPKPPDPVPPESIPPPEPSIPEPVVQPAPTREPETKPKSTPRAASTPAPRRTLPAASASAAASGAAGVTPGKPGAATSASGTNTKLRARYNPRPAYPAESRRLKQAGVVLIAAQVNAQGVPTSVSVTRSSGFSLLDQAALAAVRRWRFEPNRVAGVAVPGRVDCPVRFNLQN